MHELMMILSAKMPMDFLIDELEKSLIAYKESPNEEAMSKLSMFCMMISTREMIDKKGGDVLSIIKDVNLMGQGHELLSPKKG